jgi:hypothetical protein
MSTSELGYQTGLANQFETEAIAGVLPEGQNAPQNVTQGLYAELCTGTLCTTPRESMEKEIERIFRLLKILFSQHGLHAAYIGLRSDKQRVRDNSIEFLESLLRPELQSLLLPLFDHSVTVRERIALARQHVGTEVASAAEAVKMLIHCFWKLFVRPGYSCRPLKAETDMAV